MAIKIDRHTNLGESVSKREGATVQPRTSFEHTLSNQKNAMKGNALKELLNKVDEQAKRVSGSRTIRDLQIYKKYVRSFLQEAVQTGLGTSQSRSWQQGGAQQTLVKTVDQKLVTLTNDLLDKNKEELKLLDQLDEIRGMLINLYI
ncbi:YaaR family protein [Sporolactobacillus shoreicorticis]|uniref:YaaR family protein n=1 Tax=Sporolactobacillus shoreicorticis TaxID=1923877 RepID=A0ABW5SAZ9_9BACL|nr:YaaR family protein [Sporolactobacillus shoreicorticis]MCO7127710.1 YaaR family protein [Sporolactobacillus shoreicorticis]